MRLMNRVAIVTGGGRGLGAAYAAAIAREGGRVAVVDIDKAGADKTAAELRGTGRGSLSVHADLTDEEQVARMVDGVLSEWDKIDIVVNNAGGAPPGGTGNIEKIDRGHWDQTMAVNLTSAMLVCKAVTPHLKRQRSGKILNVSSRSARSTGWFSSVS